MSQFKGGENWREFKAERREGNEGRHTPIRARALVMAASAWSCFMMAVFISSEELGAAGELLLLLPPKKDDMLKGCIWRDKWGDLVRIVSSGV